MHRNRIQLILSRFSDPRLLCVFYRVLQFTFLRKLFLFLGFPLRFFLTRRFYIDAWLNTHNQIERAIRFRNLHNLHHFWKLHESTRGAKIYTKPVNQRRNNVRELSPTRMGEREKKKERKRNSPKRAMLKFSSNSRRCKQLWRAIKICRIKFRVCNSWCAFDEKLVLTYYRFTTQSRMSKQGEDALPCL